MDEGTSNFKQYYYEYYPNNVVKCIIILFEYYQLYL